MANDPESSAISAEQAQQMRHFSHELSNALEVIVQTSYLLGMTALDDNGRQWQGMLGKGVQQAAKVNRELREYIRLHS
jgi:hypothetical protein